MGSGPPGISPVIQRLFGCLRLPAAGMCPLSRLAGCAAPGRAEVIQRLPPWAGPPGAGGCSCSAPGRSGGFLWGLSEFDVPVLGHAVGSAVRGGDHVVQDVDPESAEDLLELDRAGDVLRAGGACAAGMVVAEKDAVRVLEQGEGGHDSGIGGYFAEAALDAVDADGPALGVDRDDGKLFEAFGFIQPLAEFFEAAPVGDPGNLVFQAGFGEDDSLLGDPDGGILPDAGGGFHEFPGFVDDRLFGSDFRAFHGVASLSPLVG